MARWLLLGLGLLALCIVVSADYWPAGEPGADKMDFEVSIASTRSSKGHKSSKGAKHGGGSYRYKKSHSHTKKTTKDDKPKASPAPKKPEVLPPGQNPPGYGEDPKSNYPKGDEDWWSGEGDENNPHEHTEEHQADCIGSRNVNVQGPLNQYCPPQSKLFDQEVCNVPTFCQGGGLSFSDGDQIPGQPPLVCACAPGEFLRGDYGDIGAHFRNQPGPFPMVDVNRHTYSCVDARAEEPILGTPGGDLAEAMAAATAIMKLTGKGFDETIAKEVFDLFADEVATEERPLYFHTDDGSLRLLFPALAGKLADPKEIPSIFPWVGPSNPADQRAWLNLLKQPLYNGCGHIRLMLVDKTLGYYSAKIEGTGNEVTSCGDTLDAQKCIDAKAVAESFIEQYFRFWWFTEPGSEQRRKIAFQIDGILQGSLRGKGVAIVQNKAPDGCPGHAPLVRGSFGGSQVFIYHGAAVLEWRTFVGREYFPDLLRAYRIDVDDFIETWTNVANMQLDATLKYLQPANRVGQFIVNVPVRELEPEEIKGYEEGEEYYDGKGRY